jgi:hypothetical protein
MSAAEWKDLLELRIVPVLDDAEPGKAVSRVFRKKPHSPPGSRQRR